MAGILYHRIRHAEEVTRTTMYRFLFNSGLVGLAFLALLAVCLLFLSQRAS
jgi:hypothetical protein